MDVSVAAPVVLDAVTTRASLVREYLSGFYPAARGFAHCPAEPAKLPANTDSLFIAADLLTADMPAWISVLRHQRPGLPIFGYGPRSEAALAVDILRAGADDWLWFDTETDLGHWPLQINRVRQRRAQTVHLQAGGVAATAFEHLPDAVFGIDTQGRVELLNAAARRLLGVQDHHPLGTSLAQLWPALQGAVAAIADDAERTLALVTPRGQRLHLALRRAEHGQLILISLRDVSAQQQLEQRLRFRIALEERITRLSTGFITLPPEAIRQSIDKAVADLGQLCNVQRCYVGEYADHDDTVSVSFEWCANDVRAHRDAMQNEPVAQLANFHNSLRRNGVVHVPSLARLPLAWNAERHFLAREGIDALLQVPMKVGRKVIGYIGFDAVGAPRAWHDDEISALRMAAVAIAHGLTRVQREDELQRTHAKLSEVNQQLSQQAREDALTRIPNRRHFDDMFRREHRRALRERRPFAVLLCDVDNFKAYNDHYGHLAGDQCLAAVAQTLQECFQRGGDVCARFGGEEFAMLLPGHTLTQGLQAAERAREAIAALARPHAKGVDGIVTVSFGVAAFEPAFRLGVDALLNCADQALYQAKDQGRNCSRAFLLSPEAARERLSIVS